MSERARTTEGPRRRTRPSRLDPEPAAVLLQTASLLLDYPGAECDADLALAAAALAELPRSTARRRLERFLDWWRLLPQASREQTYVATFDLDSAASLYLTEGRPRTSRERGAALLELREAYRRHGAAVRREELPDYLPLMLEVAAHVPACRDLLLGEREAIDDVEARLRSADSPFALVLDAVQSTLSSAHASSAASEATR